MKLPNYITPEFFEKICRKNGIVLDSNMLVLYLVGIATDGRRINGYQRLKEYDEEDFEYVKFLIENSKDKNIKISPQSITEVLYLIGMDPRRKRSNESGIVRLTEKIKNLTDITIGVLRVSDESIYESTPEIVKRNEKEDILTYGIPDLSFEKALSSNEYAFLSADSAYASFLYGHGICAASLNQLKPLM